MAYSPSSPPTDASQLGEYLYAELLQISIAFGMVEQGTYMKVWQTAPGKPREGMLAIAAGAPGWNPGAGKGLYEFKSGSWVKL